MIDDLRKFIVEAEQRITQTESREDLEKLRVELLGRKSFLSSVSAQMRDLPPESRAEVGKLLNEARKRCEQLFAEKESAAHTETPKEAADLTASLERVPCGSIHPVSAMIENICAVFKELRFDVYEGNEIEDEFHNFESLNIAKDHPSREDFDTFFLQVPEGAGGKWLLRSHTSPAQIHVMQKNKPPFAFVVPGKVYRPDAVDASHSYVFHQVEGFAVGTDLNFAHLKGVLYHFARRIFGKNCALRFRPSFFPFTEPSIEVDVRAVGADVPEKLRDKWIELGGAGMIHPQVLENCGLDSKKYRGWAFGPGLDRIAMLKWAIDDVRLMHSADLRFVNQF